MKKVAVSPTPTFAPMPPWVAEVLGLGQLDEGLEFSLGGQAFVVRNGLPRSSKLVSAAQAQTSETFGFKWKKVDTFDSPASTASSRC